MPVQCVVEDKLYFHNLRFCIRSWVTLCLSRYVYGVRSQRLSFPPPLPPFGVPFAAGRGNQMHKFMVHHTTTLHLLVILLSLVTFSHNVGNLKCDFAKNISEETSTSTTSQTLTFRHVVNNVRQIFAPFFGP